MRGGLYMLNGSGTQFLSQIAPGDLLEFGGVRVSVVDTPLATNTAVYLAADPGVGPEKFTYGIVKLSKALDLDNTRDFSMDGLILDANLVYRETVPTEADLGRLVSVTVVGADLVISVHGQSLFTVINYQSASYPYYVRNTDGSLLVIGKTAKAVTTTLTFLNQLFESSVISILNGPLKGVDSLSFNSSTPLIGEILFEEGYQVNLAPTKVTNSLKITAGKGYGLPIGCDRLFEDSVPANCGQLITYINSCEVGEDFGDFKLKAGEHVVIYPDPDRHRIYVGLQFDKVDICQPQPSRPVTQ